MEGVYLKNYVAHFNFKRSSHFIAKMISQSRNGILNKSYRHLRTTFHAGRKYRSSSFVLKKQNLDNSTNRINVLSPLLMKNELANTNAHEGQVGKKWFESCNIDEAKPQVLKNKNEKNLLLALRRGPIINTMLHKLYINLQGKNLMKDNIMSIEKTQKCKKNIMSAKCEEAEQLDSSDLSPKERFYRNLLWKHQCPSAKEVEDLKSLYPNHMKLFFDVVKPLIEADPSLKLDLVVTTHLNNSYFKAHVCFLWQNKIQETGIHPDKWQAIERVFLLMCFQLKEHGLIYKNSEGVWQATTCEKVLDMLDTIAKYGASTFGSSRGRGFKIILEQAKLSSSRINEAGEVENVKALTLTKENCADAISSINMHFNDLKDSVAKTRLHINNEICGLVHNFYKSSSKTNYDISKFISENLTTNLNSQLHMVSNSNICDNKPFWICTIHVGWPSPFTVQKQGISLPSAHMLGFMAVASKLKNIRLLSKENVDVSSTGLIRHMFMHTQQHWITTNKLASDKIAQEKFNGNAELFCDASNKGFGAYLLIEGEKQVYWLSEEWEEIRQLAQLPTNKFYLSSTLAELYAMVNAVFSWKHKLRGRRLLCLSDSKTVVGLINTFNTQLIELSSCICQADHLISILHSNCQQFGITLHASWISREQNWLADTLSRQDFNTFHKYVPHANAKRTKSRKFERKEILSSSYRQINEFLKA